MKTLQLFRTLRRLYVPFGARLSVADNVALTQGFAFGYGQVKDDLRVAELMNEASAGRTGGGREVCDRVGME